MKTLIALSIALGVAGCATQEPAQVARADCKVADSTPKSVVNKPGTMTELDRKWAEHKLAASDYRRAQFDRYGTSSNIEGALDGCR